MEAIPPQVAKQVGYAATDMSSYNKNTFLLTNQGPSTVSPNQVSTWTLPEGILDLQSLNFSFRCTCTGSGSVFAKIVGSDSLVQSLEIWAGGLCLSHISDYSTLAQMLKLSSTDYGRQVSVNRLLTHDFVDETDADDDVSVMFIPRLGFFGQQSTRFLSTAIVGEISVRITWSSPAVLLPYVTGGDHVTLANGPDRASAAAITYELKNLECHISTVSLGPGYLAMVQANLAQMPYLPVNYKDVYTYHLNGQTGDHSVRFSVSSSSIDNCMAVTRYSKYSTVGRAGKALTAASNAVSTNTYVPNYFYFKCPDGNTTPERLGNFQYDWEANSVRHPQSRGNALTSAFELTAMNDRNDISAPGHAIQSLQMYQESSFVVPLSLNHAGAGIGCRSGFSSKGSQSNMVYNLYGLSMETAADDTGKDATVSTTIGCFVTKQLRVSAARQLAIDF